MSYSSGPWWFLFPLILNISMIGLGRVKLLFLPVRRLLGLERVFF